MYLDQQRAGAVIAATWLFGLAALFATGYWWPGVMFLIGASSIIEGLVRGQGWYAFQAGLWAIGFGMWAALGYSLAVLFVVLGMSVLLGAFVRPPWPQRKPAPTVDHSLD